MINSKLLDTWDKILAEECHCYADKYGNRPCDKGAVCDKCMTEEIKEKFRKEIQI